MALKAVVENLDDVPSQYRDLYTEKNGKWEITGIEGIRTVEDVNRIQAGLVKEREEHKRTKEKFAAFADLDINEVRAKLDRIPELEAAAAGKLDDNKLNEMVEHRLRSKTAPLEREIGQLKTQVAEKDKLIANHEQEKRQNKIADAVTKAARKAGVADSAVEDAILLAERVFEVDDSGAVVVKDNVGVTPGIDPNAWFSEMESKRPHWWGASGGGGSRGGRPPTTEKNPFSHEHWNLTEQGKLVSTDRVKAERLATQAGTKIGGQRPAAKK